ncbi:ribose transport system ATP-binding protein [Lachnospiraceae bacterium PF1-21]|uniref:Sugar ABC transporter ATP-binding protein n=1 Tax=Ohessyouella blattaphilus TaxID=2949333 RepID=A0ABT1EFD9_9FIRM|nr:sugar ABC transporter ATP-binding protein [Ohessyouella blattaphilus]MCP1109405.1 sugar ABC transporter ATP-binding protein [Ohessyouella blattaphilus]MCR8562799.1 sugar ABC transporter ATP-binding protein [Ohessyouella blattaphilus]MDL2249290.1 sugar ABC transporter ATP-binding protein [Lachnospiraceae bacterium OttesenSCG-928-J05]
MSEYVVELKGITKRFPGVVALKNMNLSVKPGEILGLIGENGAGKSTLIKVLTGVYQAEEGEIYVNGQKQKFRDPNDSAAAGIACVYQELNIEKLLSVTDNIFINKWIRGKGGLLDYPAMNEKAREVMASLGIDIDPSKLAGTFGMGVQQMIEIAKAILIDAKMIIMDEPTSSLGEKEVELLMTICRKLKAKGISIIFISHKLEELFELCDRVTVMRDGEHIWTKQTEDTDSDDLVKAMVGRCVDQLFVKIDTQQGDCALRVENINSAGVLHDVSFEAYKGQILGFSGLVGAGRTELMRAVFGADPIDSGKIFLHGKDVKIKSPKQAIRHKIAFLTEDRKGQGLILGQSVQMNLILANMAGFCKGPFIDDKKVCQTGDHNCSSLRIKTPSQYEVVRQLSGGNQQKVVIGKWINCDADIYIFDEPTRGIDVGAKVEVYNVMNELIKEGKCVIMISSEMPEILGMSDRVIVMREGRIMATVDRESEYFNQEAIMKAAWGGKIDE